MIYQLRRSVGGHDAPGFVAANRAEVACVFTAGQQMQKLRLTPLAFGGRDIPFAFRSAGFQPVIELNAILRC